MPQPITIHNSGPRRYLAPALLTLALIAVMLTAIAIATSTADAQTPPAAPAPTDLTATFSDGEILLSWTAPEGVGVDGYQIRRRLVAPGNRLAPIVPDTGDSETNYTDTDITEAGTYAYRVRTIVDGETGRTTPPETVEVSESDIQRNVLAAELARLKEALAKHHDGCAIYEVDGPNGKTYAVDTANAQCVSLRELATIHCIPQLDIARTDETRLTVVNESQPYLVGSLTWFQISWADFNLYPVRSTKNKATYIKTYAAEHDRFDVELQRETVNFQASTGRLPDNTDQADTLLFIQHSVTDLWFRVQDIANGAEYRVPSNCTFTDDVQGHVDYLFTAQKEASYTVGNSERGEMDTGDDVDIYQTELTGGQEYVLTLTGVDPIHLDLDELPFESGYDENGAYHNRYQRPINLINPTVQILDSDGNTVSGPYAGGVHLYTPDDSGPHYVRVSRSDEGDDDLAGVYQFALHARVDERNSDTFTEGTNTPSSYLQGTDLATGTVQTPGDVDWIRIPVARGQQYTVTADSFSDHENEQTHIQGVYDINGDPVSFAAGHAGAADVDGTATFTAVSSGFHYATVAGDGTNSHYGYRLELHEDDHTAHGATPMTPLVLGDDPVAGELQSEWDLDAFSFQLPKNSIWYGIRITAATPGVHMTATVHADNDLDNGRYKTLSVRDGGDVTVYVRHNNDNPHSNWTGRFQVRLHPENQIDGNGRYTVSLVNGQIRDVPTEDDHPDGTGHDGTETLHEGGSVSGFISDAQDQDFFKLESGLQGSFSLELELPPAVTRIIYFLHSASGEYASALPDLPVNIDTTTEDWYVLVHSHDPEARTEYTITLDRLDDPDDPGEPEEEEEKVDLKLN